MSKNTKTWQEKLMDEVNITPLKNGKYDWKTISQVIMLEYPEVFEGTSSPSEKCRSTFNRNKGSSLILKKEDDYTLEEAIKEKKASTTHKTKGKKIEPSTEEVLESTRNISTSYDSKAGKQSSEIEVLVKSRNSGNLKNESFLMKEVFQVDPDEYELTNFGIRASSWDAMGSDGEKLEAHRVSGTFKKRINTMSKESYEKLLKRFAEEALKDTSPSEIKSFKPVKISDGKLIVVLSIADLHLGKLAWEPETGENYDYKIAKKNFYKIIADAIERIKMMKTMDGNIDKIIFFWSQDFFHYDSLNVTTTAGTSQDTDVRWQKLFEEGVLMLVNAIKALSEEAPVETFYTRSNHDEMTGYHATVALAQRFYDDPQVEVSMSPSKRKYIHYGVNLLGFAHGDKEGKRIAACMANDVDSKPYWSKTTNHEFFLGHFHSEHVKDDAGVTCRYLSSPTSTDAWHHESGYVGAQRNAQLFIRHKEYGQIGNFIIPV